ncbi:MAG: SDR family NAD(P)-dependent oxidoreductase [Candidatus Promineifilaceae bacterium]|nr:SDR family NAD(P)-dependent oxidoreductase [Candidatus Promineifilaceae bacterium]
MDFAGKVVLVTGASRGIGKAVALQFAQAKAHVAVHYHRQVESARNVLHALPGGPHQIFQADQRDPQEAQRLVEAVVAEMGQLDILINNAGIFREHPLVGVDYDEWQAAWQDTLAVNLLGPANLMYWAARHMIDHGGGRIVNVSSRGAFRGEPEAPAYGASKAGLNALSQSLAKALAPHGVFVTVVAPGFVETDMAVNALTGSRGARIKAQSPLNRVARPDEVARTVLFLASEGTDFLTGAIVDVNGASYLRT